MIGAILYQCRDLSLLMLLRLLVMGGGSTALFKRSEHGCRILLFKFEERVVATVAAQHDILLAPMVVIVSLNGAAPRHDTSHLVVERR